MTYIYIYTVTVTVTVTGMVTVTVDLFSTLPPGYTISKLGQIFAGTQYPCMECMKVAFVLSLEDCPCNVVCLSESHNQIRTSHSCNATFFVWQLVSDMGVGLIVHFSLEDVAKINTP
jgi:hypothetical protein